MRVGKIIFTALGIISLASCGIDDALKVDLVELGALQRTIVVEAEMSEVPVTVYSNGPFHIELDGEDTSWISLSEESGSGDCTVTAYCAFNEEFKRAAKIILCSEVDSRRDTINIRQKGLVEAVLKLDNTSVVAAGRGGDESIKVRTNVPFEYMKLEKIYDKDIDDDWIRNVEIKDDQSGTGITDMVFSLKPNPDEVAPRTASVIVSFTDGWGDSVRIMVNLVQRNAKEGLGRVISFLDFKNTYATGNPVNDYVIIDGVVISNTQGGNAGENDQKTSSTIDYSYSDRTIYVESTDGTLGFSLLTETAEDNITNQFDRIQILMHGATAVIKENPERVDITGITKSMIVSQVPGTKADVPVKERHINSLTDDDIYTYVTLTDVEIPVRKGSICPVGENMTIATNGHRLTKYPLLIRDINGDVSYLMTNTVCRYRNDGTRLPYGSGKLSGVLVHERFSRFEWRNGADPLDIDDDPTLGFISRYQLRHQTKEDIWGQMNDSVEDSFSALLAEYRFMNPDMDNWVLRPTYGDNGWFTHTYQTKYTGDPEKTYNMMTYRQHLYGGYCYSYLGPVGSRDEYLFGKNFGNRNGLGIVLDPAKEHYNPVMDEFISRNPDGSIEWCGQYAANQYAGYGAGGWSEGASHGKKINYDGRGMAEADCMTAFANSFWWDDQTQRPYGWLLNFSTKGIATSHLSLQISVSNTQWFCPRFWKAEWSYTDAQDEEHDKDWHLISEYTVPDESYYTNTLFSSLTAFKYINFSLPLEILGQENVYIRLVPVNDLCSDGVDYANARMDEASSGLALSWGHKSLLEYIAVRYNK